MYVRTALMMHRRRMIGVPLSIGIVFRPRTVKSSFKVETGGSEDDLVGW
jgi:hypothetical protein